MNLLIFQNPDEFKKFFFTFLKIPFAIKIETMTTENFFCVILLQKHIQNS